ncbi:diguanylate cyclase domain-containing protein [Tsukamurella soli]|uniref:diguanylate cyclase domain-containing protein n=1 Tax=Tsukamurella soli TaxID=644556 RepID=UPI0036222DA4
MVTVSAGTAELRAPASLSPDLWPGVIRALVDRADQALYRAKASGRDMIVHDRTVVTAADLRGSTTSIATAPDADGPALHATIWGLRFQRRDDETRFRRAFEVQGRRVRRLIMVGLLVVCAAIFAFQQPLLEVPPGAVTVGRLILGVGLMPAATVALIAASWSRVYRWSSPVYVGCVAVILTAQMFERAIETPRGLNLVPFLMPVSVLLSLCVVRIACSLLVPSMAALTAAVVVCEVATVRMTGNEFLAILTAIVMASVSVRFAYQLERSRRLDWSRSRQLAALSLTDPLTLMPNRRSFIAALRDELAAGRGAALVLLDVDRFKDYNDRFGHLAGDDCLRAVGAQLARAADACAGVAARLGGEEFAVILPAGGVGLAEVIRAAVTGPDPDLGGAAGPITASAGLAVWPADAVVSDPDVAVEHLVERADRALYEAKRNGRDRLEVDGGRALAAEPDDAPP